MRNAVFFVFSFYLVFGVILTVFQQRIIYQPFPRDFDSCAALSSAENIRHQGTRMYFKNNGPRLAVLYHGNAGSACDRAFYADMFEQAGYSYLLPEYAGYSSDTVKPSHELLKKDVENVAGFLAERRFPEIVVVGESLGSIFASYHVSLAPPHKLLLISPFTSFVDIAKVHYWYYPVSLLVKNPLDNARLLDNFSGEMLLIHGDKDRIVPLTLGKKLFNEIATPLKKMVVIPQAGHNNLFLFPETEQTILDFLK